MSTMLTTQQREIIIRLKAEGKKQQHIASIIGCSQAAVSKWLAKHKTGRTLETLPRSGRPTKLTEGKLNRLRIKLWNEIRKVNEAYCSLSTKQLREIMAKEVGKSYSIRHVERVMHRLGFSLITPRAQHLRHDQEKVDKFKDMLKKNLKRNIWVLSSSPLMK